MFRSKKEKDKPQPKGKIRSLNKLSSFGLEGDGKSDADLRRNGNGNGVLGVGGGARMTASSVPNDIFSGDNDASNLLDHGLGGGAKSPPSGVDRKNMSTGIINSGGKSKAAKAFSRSAKTFKPSLGGFAAGHHSNYASLNDEDIPNPKIRQGASGEDGRERDDHGYGHGHSHGPGHKDRKPSRPLNLGGNADAHNPDMAAGMVSYRKPKHYKISDPTDPLAVSDLVTHLTPLRTAITPDAPLSNPTAATDAATNANVGAANPKQGSSAPTPHPSGEHEKQSKLYNECLLAMRVARFEFSGSDGKASTTTHADFGNNYGTIRKNISHINPKTKNKLRYVCITRSTNQLLMKRRRRGRVLYKKKLNVSELDGGVLDAMDDHGDPNETLSDEDDEVESSSDDDENDADSNDDYSLLYNPETSHKYRATAMIKKQSSRSRRQRSQSHLSGDGGRTGGDEKQSQASSIMMDERSSFPSLVCLAIQSDGTNPQVRQVLDLDQLVAIESVANKGTVQLIFQNNVIVEIDCDVGTDGSSGGKSGGGGDNDNDNNNAGGGVRVGRNGQHNGNNNSIEKNRFLWSLLQIHAILCTAVVERNLSRVADGGTSGGGAGGTYLTSRANPATAALPNLTMRNVDRAELQYISTVNGFLSDNPVLCTLLERQRNLGAISSGENKSRGEGGSTSRGGKERLGSGSMDEEKTNAVDEMDGIAYDMIMGNFTSLTLFLSEEEKKDAEEILNSTILQQTSQANVQGDGISADDDQSGRGEKLAMDEIDTAETLTELLQKRMRDLEAETCRRLIAWEDEKFNVAPVQEEEESMKELKLANLYKTLNDLEKELDDMEEWLSDKAAAIKPLTDECREVEEVNRQLEQQNYSYELLAIELGRLFDGLEVDSEMEHILRDPTSIMVYNANGEINVKESEACVEDIYRAGKALKMAFDKVQEEGGVHLRAVSERVENLLTFSNHFCISVRKIIIDVMKRTMVEVQSNDDAAKEKHASHAIVAKSIRNIQRQFQSSLLAYIKLIEVLALLKPSILPAVRESYSELVSEGILSKKRLKTYFVSLPGKSSVNMEMCTVDLSIYPPVALRSQPTTESNNQHMKPVQAKDVEIALTELLPVIAREAYFTAALFGLSAKHLSGREKKRNFESAKRSVDFCSQYFKYYIARICGIASEADAEGKKVFADPMLSLVASILLNEAMENYIDRQKKGGDHSLSLAYVRATILDLRKKVDKQWVSWVEEQIKWIKSSPGVPLTGKRAGVFTAIARFPSYLDHVLICCKAGRPKNHVPNLSKIKVVAYYLQKLAAALFNSLHECSERETTDQQYAANVMRMENSYFFTQSIKQRGPELTDLFQQQITAASSICKQSTDAYLGFMIKREFKSLHSLFANISRIRREVGDGDVPIHVPRSTFEKTLSKECNRETLKEKIGTIYYRMEKHLSEAGGLLPVAWKALVKVLYEWFGRWEKLSSQCYRFSLEPSASDVVRIAKQAAGISAKKISDEKKRANGNQGRH